MQLFKIDEILKVGCSDLFQGFSIMYIIPCQLSIVNPNFWVA
jgi:hypothetical protein